uniref:hypothetical protein n=1 Tax=Proteus mirabilis TaxID=584 RepID=UPI001ADDBE05
IFLILIFFKSIKWFFVSNSQGEATTDQYTLILTVLLNAIGEYENNKNNVSDFHITPSFY